MKKILLLAFCASLFACTSTNAQNLKQSGGEKNLQVLFAPLGGSPISINGIAYRKFNATGNRAWRLNLFLGLTNKTDVTTQPIDTGTFATGGGRPEGDKKTSSMTFSLRPGYEWHCAGTDRLSPYCGVELLFSLTTAKTDMDSVGYANFTSTSSSPNPTAYQVYTTTQKGKGGSTTFGLNLVAGVDYYIAKSLSLGAELGFGFSMTTMPDIEDQHLKDTQTTASNGDVTNTFTVEDSAKQKQGKSIQVGPNAVAQIKLGWLF